MALFDGLLGGGSADPYDLYGDILTTKQREALRARSSDQTWANAANFLAKAAMPTNKKIPLGGLLAGLAGAMGGSNQDEAVQTALKGALTTQQIAKLRREQKLLAELDPIQKELLRRQLALGGGGAPAVPTANQPSVQTVPPAAGPAPTATPLPGGAPLPSWSAGVPSQDLSRWGLPMRPRGGPLSATASEVSSEDRPLLPIPPAPPGGRITPADYGVPGSQSSLDPAALQGLLAMAGGGDGGEDIWSQLASMQGGAAPGTPPFDLASLGTSQGLPDLGPVQVEPLSGKAAPAGGNWERDDPLIRKYESGNRNIMQGVVGPEGGYNPSVGRVTGPSSAGGYYQMIDPTWRGAAAKAGIDTKEYSRAIDAPFEVQQKVAKKLYEEEGLRPWAPYNRNLAAATGYSGGLPDAGRVNIEPLGGEATPAGRSGVIPGLGITPEALATLNSMYKAAGVDSPFGSLLETYYKSPGYLEEKARTEEVAKKRVAQEYDPLIATQTETAKAKVELEYKPKIEEAVQRLQSPILKEREQAKADIDRYTKELEQNRQAGFTPTTVTVTFPGEDTQREITIAAAQLPALATGQGIPELGIPPGARLGKTVERPEALKQQEIDQKFLEEKRVQAESSRRAIMAANDTRQLIEKGVIAGSYADERTRLLKLGQLLNLTGKDDNDRIRQTEAYIANLGRGMKEGLKGLGPPVSNVDIQIAERIAGGQNLTTQGMLELLKLEEKYHRLALQDYGKLLSSAPKSRYDKSVKEPPTFGAPIADNPDGVAHWWDGKTWRPL